MVVKRILSGIVITLVVLVVARMLSKNNSQVIEAESEGLKAVHGTVFEQVGGGNPVVEISVESEGEAYVSLIYEDTVEGEIRKKEMTEEPGGVWRGELPDLGKGERVEYAFIVEGRGANALRIPEGDDEFFLLKYKGHISTFVLVVHVIFMFGAFFFMVESTLGAAAMLKKGEEKGFTLNMMRSAVLCLFVGGWPLGFILNYQRFGPVWEAFPFGTDVTDNKTQIIMLLWLIAAFLIRGSFFGRGEEKDILKSKGFAVAVITCFVLTVILFLVPHSL